MFAFVQNTETQISNRLYRQTETLLRAEKSFYYSLESCDGGQKPFVLQCGHFKILSLPI